MDEEYVHGLLKSYTSAPRFADGRVDFSDTVSAPVLNIFVVFDGEVLLLKRSDKVGSYRGFWNVVGGYIDEPVSLEEKVFEELSEELGITQKQVASVAFAERFSVFDEDIPKEWLVHPVLVELKMKVEPVLDWEHTAFVWITPERFGEFLLVKGFEEAFDALLDNVPVLSLLFVKGESKRESEKE